MTDFNLLLTPQNQWFSSNKSLPQKDLPQKSPSSKQIPGFSPDFTVFGDLGICLLQFNPKGKYKTMENYLKHNEKEKSIEKVGYRVSGSLAQGLRPQYRGRKYGVTTKMSHAHTKMAHAHPNRFLWLLRCCLLYFQPCTYLFMYLHIYIYIYRRGRLVSRVQSSASGTSKSMIFLK